MNRDFRKYASVLMSAAMLMTSGIIGTWADAAPETALLLEINESEGEIPFQIEYKGESFTLSVDENPTTGYIWSYEAYDKDLLRCTSDEYVDLSKGLIGGGGSRQFTFETSKDGETAIEFNLSRSWEKESIKSFIIDVARKDGKISVERAAAEIAIDTSKILMYNDKNIDTDVVIESINGVTMIPVSAVLREMGYKVTWKEENNSVDISKGARITSVKVGENKYIKSKMAPIALSSAPVNLNGRVMVPAEFFAEILNIGMRIDENKIILTDMEPVIREGFISEIKVSDGKTKQIYISSERDNDDINLTVIINVSDDTTIYNKSIRKGDHIKAICSMITTMSIPAQTPGYVIY